MLTEIIQNFYNSKRAIETPSVLINILTRTSGRPNGFKRCRNSIEHQSYPYVRHLVSYDTEEDLKYLKDYKCELIKVKRKALLKLPGIKRKTTGYKPYNLYCNKLLSKVKEGWVLFLDDDDMLMHNKVLEELVNIILRVDLSTLIIWRTRYPDGGLLPNDEAFNKKIIEYQNIDTACFGFHSTYINYGRWDAYIGADYRFLKEISKAIPKQEWIPLAYTQKNNFGDHGRRNDIIE